jgi:hypothetical protein
MAHEIQQEIKYVLYSQLHKGDVYGELFKVWNISNSMANLECCTTKYGMPPPSSRMKK